ncbi:carbohydrate ABC transporter permease [Clostridium sp. YIM B02515]|uniref:Carbohydrate ABC transporter permease n=1 Tax=Clostridium rhizosphaerae TaxID=2803861 RepID=A0ABS1TGV0_9CLOT|nr:carbohydrate ABC transporter permease [Clostridium rhizosphaerae]MBL4937836.1 carbohydrate ABC transporter permease [Clostridium rhizosphaerae]
MNKDGKIFNAFNIVIVSIVTITILFPIINVVALSFNDASDAMSGGIYLWPRVFSFANYRAVLQNSDIYRAFIISVEKTVVGVVTHVLFTAMVAYGMSHKELKFRNIYMKMGIFAMFFGGGMVPYFLLIKALGLYNSFWVYIWPALFSFYNMIIIMNFFKDLPPALSESAQVEGAGHFYIFTRIYLPLSVPVLATIALFIGVAQWNEYMPARLFVPNTKLWPLQMLLYQIIIKSQTARMVNNMTSVVIQTSTRGVQLATMVITTLPIVLIYPLLQRYFISGMLVGAVKE